MEIPVLDEALVFLDGYVDRVEGSVLHAELANFFEHGFRVLVEGRRVADEHDHFLGRRRPSHPIDRGPHRTERILLPFATVVCLDVVEEVDELVGRDGHLHDLDRFAAAAEHHDADAGDRDEAVDGENQLLHLRLDFVDDEAHRTGAVDHDGAPEAGADSASVAVTDAAAASSANSGAHHAADVMGGGADRIGTVRGDDRAFDRKWRRLRHRHLRHLKRLEVIAAAAAAAGLQVDHDEFAALLDVHAP